jgi:hypothetical protein
MRIHAPARPLMGSQRFRTMHHFIPGRCWESGDYIGLRKYSQRGQEYNHTTGSL